MTRAILEGEPPVWLRRALWTAILGVAVLLCMEVLVLRPGYAMGDETDQIRRLVGLADGQPLVWHWAQGCLQRAGLWL
ncbi:MAG: hypothetical protein ACREKE_08285, partial [bacterium]